MKASKAEKTISQSADVSAIIEGLINADGQNHGCSLSSMYKKDMPV